MHVVEVDGDEEAVGQQPCGGVCKADGGVAAPAHDGKADKAAGDRLKHACKHGLLREADALNEESEHVDKRQQEIAAGVPHQKLLRQQTDLVPDGGALLRVEEQQRQLAAEEGKNAEAEGE